MDALDYNPGRFKDFSRTLNGNENGQLRISNEHLSSCFRNLTINVVNEGDEESHCLEQIGPCPPGSELNNWIAEELPVIFKTNIECSDINGVSNIIPDSQVDFEQNPRIQGSFAEGAIDTKQSMTTSEKLPLHQKNVSTTAYPFGLKENGNLYFQTIAYLFRLMENRTPSVWHHRVRMDKSPSP
ncbi:hypothetical protein GQ457_05G019670 [Hibiscus cannabinus]